MSHGNPREVNGDPSVDNVRVLDQACIPATTHILLYEFAESVDQEEYETLLVMATAAVEGLHGCTAVRLEAAFTPFVQQRLVEIDDAMETGKSFARVLCFIAGRVLGQDALKVTRIPRGDRPHGIPEWMETL